MAAKNMFRTASGLVGVAAGSAAAVHMATPAEQRTQLKVKTIRYNLLCALSLTQAEKGSLRDTKSAFFHL